MAGLSRCVGDVPRFLDHYWARAPLHRGAKETGGFEDLLSLEDVDHIVASTSPRVPQFRLVRDGKPLDPSSYTKSARLGGRTVPGVADPGKVFGEFQRGATIVLQGLHRSWAPLTRFCRELELELTYPTQANAYITPAGSQGLAVHYDTHDVFVLQVAGHKAWTVYEPVLEDPLPSQPWTQATQPGPGDPGLEIDLRAGDLLYVPRGFLHAAKAQDDVSAHLTIGVLAPTWYDLVRDVLNGLAGQRELRRSLPPGFAHHPERLPGELAAKLDAVRVWLEGADTQAATTAAARRFWSNRPPILAGQLGQLLAVERLDDSSPVRRREGAVCQVTVEEDRLSVLLGDRELRMPMALEPVVRRLVQTGADPILVGDLDDQLDGPSRFVLVRRLVREGLLEIVNIG